MARCTIYAHAAAAAHTTIATPVYTHTTAVLLLCRMLLVVAASMAIMAASWGVLGRLRAAI